MAGGRMIQDFLKSPVTTAEFNVESNITREKRIKEIIESIQSKLQSIGDGEISVSPHDTAWVSLVEDINGSKNPQFPETLEWIVNNQLPDGSWGDQNFFQFYDRIISTLACVVALKFWNIHPLMIQKGLVFIRNNFNKLEEESTVHMPIGFEVAFPSLVETAQKLGVDIPYDSPFMTEIYDRKKFKLSRLPMDMLHSTPTALLHSLEGMEGLDWEKLLPLKSKNGDFYFSPASTAYAFMQTKDPDCLRYLTYVVKTFKGAVPYLYPVDIYSRAWAIDRLQRLGISRYFQTEIQDFVSYIYREWSDNDGISLGRNTRVYDVDDTSMAFKALRLHGYNVSADVFQNFLEGDKFFCYAGQASEGVSVMFNLYRASQLMFPQEKILAAANLFSSNFLRDKRARNDFVDKWFIGKDIPGEVCYALDFPWYASLPRVEARIFLEQYGGEDDVWIGKTLNRMPNINSNEYLELGKLDYSNCQELHQMEWRNIIQEWYIESGLGELGLSEQSLLLAYYLAMACIFEPEKSQERIAWAKTAALVNVIKAYLSSRHSYLQDKRIFLQEMELHNNNGSPNYVNDETGREKLRRRLVQILNGTIVQLSSDAVPTYGTDVYQHLRNAWKKWLGGDILVIQGEAELIVNTLNLYRTRVEDSLMSHPKYQQLLDVTNRICLQIGQFRSQLKMNPKVENNRRDDHDFGGISSMSSVASDMQELVELVLSKSSDDIDADTKNTFLMVAKTFYYTAHCNPQVIHSQIAKVLFEKVF